MHNRITASNKMNSNQHAEVNLKHYTSLDERLFLTDVIIVLNRVVTCDRWWLKGKCANSKVLLTGGTTPTIFFFSVKNKYSFSSASSPLSGWLRFGPSSFRVWNSIPRKPCHCPPAGHPDGACDPGSHSPTAPESAGSFPQAPQRHTGHHLWSLHWPLSKEKSQ